MADVFKILGQLDVAATTETSLYVVPVPEEVRRGATQTLITSLIVCCRSGSGNYTVKLRSVNGTDGGASEYLIKERVLNAPDTDVLSLGLVLPGDSEIRVEASTADYSFNLLGIEVS